MILDKRGLKLCTFAESTPTDCGRGCNKFFEAHTTRLSFAIYTHPTIEPSHVCVYTFSCKAELRFHHDIEDGETINDTVTKVLTEALRLHTADAATELELTRAAIN